jgi:hypothetical protein
MKVLLHITPLVVLLAIATRRYGKQRLFQIGGDLITD